ncbi:MAG: ATP-binding protein [Candidatus Pacebacteria bacterium]|nr:ATP-binding protein [Candidatus Paceibacterota bacterium]
MNIISTIILIAGATELSLLFVLLFGDKDRSLFSIITFMVFHLLWIVSFVILVAIGDPSVTKMGHLLASVSKHITVEDFVIPIFKFQYFMAGVSASLLFYFTLIFPDNARPKKYIPIAIACENLVLLLLIFFTPILGDITYQNEIEGWGQAFSPLVLALDIFVFFFYISAIYVLFTKRRKIKTEDKAKFDSVFSTLIIGLFPVLIGGIILPQADVYALYLVWPTASVAFLALLSYSILNFKKMGIKSVFFKTFIGTAVLVLVVNLFVSEVSGVSVKTIIFVSFVVVARLLLSNILKESERKKEIEALNDELDSLHTNLAEKVIERTKELAEAEAHSETLLESLTVGVVEYDENFKVLRLNQAAENLLNMGREEIVGRTIKPEDKGDRKLESISTVLYPGTETEDMQTGATEEFEEGISKNSVILRSPTRREVQIITIPIKGLDAKEILRYVKLLRDVTHENIVNRSKSEFIKIAAHQLRTPLTGVKWALHSILDKDFGEMPKDENSLVENMYDANGSLIDIVNDLLAINRIEGDLGYKKTKDDIARVIQESIRSSLILKKDKKVFVEFKNNAPELAQFSFDVVKITIALKNMIGNAIEYTPSDGKIVVGLSEKDRGAVITVSDTGVGISPDKLGSLFTESDRSKEAPDMSSNRSNLGLHITKEIIEKHGGTFTVERGKEVGTLITMRLPMR